MRSCLAILLTASSACYLDHLGEAGVAPGRDAGARDAAFDAAVPDDARTPSMDANPADTAPSSDANVGRDGAPSDAARLDGGRRDAGPRVDAGRPSIALAFAPDDRVLATPQPDLFLTGAHSLELWVRARGDGTVTSKGTVASGFYHLALFVEGSEIVSRVGVGAGALGVELRAELPLGEWTHVALVVEPLDAIARELRLIVNGTLQTTVVTDLDFAASFSDAAFTLGGFEGDLDEVRIWSFARTPLAIVASMRRRIPPDAPGLIAYWPIEERGGQVLLDRTLRGHDAILGELVEPDARDPAWIVDGPL